MGLRDQLQRVADQALKSAGDLRVSCAYTSVTTGAYDPVADTVSNTTTSYSFLAVLTGLTDAEMEWFPADKKTSKLIVSFMDLPVSPTLNDYVVIESVRWEVRRVRGVPGDLIHQIFIQEL